MKYALVFVGLVFVAGCEDIGIHRVDESAAETPQAATPVNAGSDGPTPIGSGMAGGVTPMTGTEGVQGGGSAAGSVAKDRARGVAGVAGGSSMEQLSDE